MCAPATGTHPTLASSNQPEVQLNTEPGAISFHIRGERVATYDTTSIFPGLIDLRVAGKSLTRADVHHGVEWLPGRVGGVLYGCTTPAIDTDGATNARGSVQTRQLTCRRGAYSVGVKQEMEFHDPAGHLLLTAAMNCRLTPSMSEGSSIDLSLRLTAPDDQSVCLGTTQYPMMRVQLKRSVFPENGGHLRSSNPAEALDLSQPHVSSWISAMGVIEGEVVGIAVFDHPDNITFPSVWRADAENGISIHPFALKEKEKEIDLLPLEVVTFRFRLLTHAGYVDDGWPRDRASEFAREPLRV